MLATNVSNVSNDFVKIFFEIFILKYIFLIFMGLWMDIIANNLSAVLYHDSRGHMIQATSSSHQFYLHNISIIIFFLPLFVNSGDSKLLEEAVIPLAKTLSTFTIMPFVCVCLWAFSMTGISVELRQ